MGAVSRYEFPYPPPEVAARHPFVPLEFERLPEDEMRRRAAEMSVLRIVKSLPVVFRCLAAQR